MRPHAITMNLEKSLKKSIIKHIPLFIKHLLNNRGYSKLTAQSYETSLYEAFEHIDIEKQEDVIELNLMPYRLKIAHLKPKKIRKKLSALHSFNEYLNDNGFKTRLRADESIKVAKTLPKPITHEHIQEALSLSDEREKIIVTLLYTLGLRISELANLRIEDVKQGWLRVDGKGSKQRDIPILDTTQQLLKQYIEQYAPKKFLFEKNGKKLSENSLRYSVNKVFARISMKVTPHQLRHSYATELLNGGAPIVDVSELLGHASMATTQIYTKLGSALKKQNYEKAHPLSGAK